MKTQKTSIEVFIYDIKVYDRTYHIVYAVEVNGVKVSEDIYERGHARGYEKDVFKQALINGHAVELILGTLSIPLILSAPVQTAGKTLLETIDTTGEKDIISLHAELQECAFQVAHCIEPNDPIDAQDVQKHLMRFANAIINQCQ